MDNDFDIGSPSSVLDHEMLSPSEIPTKSPDDLIDFGYYFKNLKPKEIRNALNNFKNEVAENTRMFKQQ